MGPSCVRSKVKLQLPHDAGYLQWPCSWHSFRSCERDWFCSLTGSQPRGVPAFWCHQLAPLLPWTPFTVSLTSVEQLLLKTLKCLEWWERFSTGLTFSNSLLKLMASSEFLFGDVGIVWRISDGVCLALSISVLCRSMTLPRLIRSWFPFDLKEWVAWYSGWCCTSELNPVWQDWLPDSKLRSEFIPVVKQSPPTEILMIVIVH